LKHKPSILEVLLIFRVIGVRGSSDFNVSCYLHPAWVKKLIDAVTSLSLPNFHRKGPGRLSAHPVLLNKPILALSRMFSAHPLPQAVINIITYNIKGLFGHNVPVIVYPPSENRVEISYQNTGGQSPMLSDCIPDRYIPPSATY
jgi:hypothetical protein